MPAGSAETAGTLIVISSESTILRSVHETSSGVDTIGRPIVLTCLECGERADERARGWRALIPYFEEADEAPDLSLYCPSCAAREFGPARLETAAS